MQHTDSFSSYHPSVQFVYFAAVLSFSMCFMHPLCLLASLCGSLLYFFSLSPSAAKTVKRTVLPVLILTSVMNPLLSHKGQTILFYLPTKNPLTLESVIYGFSAGLMLSCVLLWFFCFSAVMTSDKFVYLFSGVSPSLSLLLSMTLRFIPLFKRQLETAVEIQFALLCPDKNRFKKAEISISAFVSVISQSLENAARTADSMKSRGYGTTKRTSYKIYKFENRDKAALSFVLFCAVFIICGAFSGSLHFRYYPDINGSSDILTVLLITAFSLLCLMPFYLHRREAVMWKHLISEI